MKIRNVKTSLLVLVSLVVISLAFYVSAEVSSLPVGNIFLDSDQDGLSDEEEKSLGTDPKSRDTDNDGYSDGVEVKTGYDPRKSAPGDRIVTEEKKGENPISQTNVNENNLTTKMAQKIALLANDSAAKGESISLDEVRTLTSDLLAPEASQEIKLPEIKKEDLKIKKQDYKKYSKEKAAAKRKEDFSTYITTVFYVLSSNSPKPITSSTTLSNIFNSLSQEIIQAITLRSTASLEKLSESGEKIQEQLMEIEIPEELADTHIKIIQFVRYSQDAKKLLNPLSTDPVADIANLSQLTGLVTELMSFTSEVDTKFSEYGLTYDEDLKKKLQGLGLDLPKDIQEALKKEQANSATEEKK